MRRILLATVLVLLTMIAVPRIAVAYDPYTAACNSGGGTSVSGSLPCTSRNQTTNPLIGSNGIFMKAERILAVIAGIAAVIVIMVSGLQFITASGDAQKVAKARTALLYALIGLVVIVLAQSILTFIISKAT